MARDDDFDDGDEVYVIRGRGAVSNFLGGMFGGGQADEPDDDEPDDDEPDDAPPPARRRGERAPARSRREEPDDDEPDDEGDPPPRRPGKGAAAYFDQRPRRRA